MSQLEPPPIQVLAEHVRDGDWLDIRSVEQGATLQRVRIESINVHRDRDVLVLVEKRFDPATETLSTATMQLDAEDVRWVRKTTLAAPVEVAASEPPPPSPTPLGEQVSRLLGRAELSTAELGSAEDDEAADKRCLQAILEVTAEARGVGGGELQSGRGGLFGADMASCARREALWLAYEMTSLPVHSLAWFFGLPQEALLRMSVALSADHICGETTSAWLGRVRALRIVTSDHLGARPHRRAMAERPYMPRL